MARRVKLQHGELVDDGPVVPRKPIKKGPKTLYVHHKQQGLLPHWVLDNYTIKTTLKKPEGRTKKRVITHALADIARRKVKEGMAEIAAARETFKEVKAIPEIYNYCLAHARKNKVKDPKLDPVHRMIKNALRNGT